MKLRNKKTGEIVKFSGFGVTVVGENKETHSEIFGSLAELNEEWEDYKDELFYVISAEHKDGYICALKDEYQELCDVAKELGIGFETEEEAKKAVEKLKAWKRLKDKGFRFEGINQDYTRFNQQDPMRIGRKYFQFSKSEDEEWIKENWKDLDLLFGGEE